ncbi:MAG: DMT family protein [Bacteroidota bacterium]
MSLKAIMTLLLLTAANIFMTLAWYGHLKIKELEWAKNFNWPTLIFLSWCIAFFEYCLQVPANRIGFQENGGPFSLIQLKVIQEVITLIVFVIFSQIFFKNETLQWNHYTAFLLLTGAVYLVFK